MLNIHAMKKWYRLIVVLLCIGPPLIGAAQAIGNGGEWGPSQYLPCDVDGDVNAVYPQVVVDRQGQLHVVWQSGTSIFYCYMYEGKWSEKTDVIATPEEEGFILWAVEIDKQDRLNILWADQGRTRDVLLSRAYVSVADQPRSWETQSLYSPQTAIHGAHLTAGGDGELHVVYAPDTRSIHYLVSTKNGEDWTGPYTIWETSDPENEAPVYPRIAVDHYGNLHVTWSLSALEQNWLGKAVYYARSTDGGATWNAREVQRSPQEGITVDWINLAVRNEDEIHLAWNRGVASGDGRYHSWSSDNGITWSQPATFLPPQVNGQTGYPLMAVDASGILHLVTIAQGGMVQNENTCDKKSGCGGLKYAYWDGQTWSSMYEFQEGSADRMIALAVGLGNQLYFIHPEARAGARTEARLMYNEMITEAPRTLPELIPPIASEATTLTEPTPTPIPSTPTQPVLDAEARAYPPTIEPAISPIITSSTVAAAVLLLILAVWHIARRKR